MFIICCCSDTKHSVAQSVGHLPQDLLIWTYINELLWPLCLYCYIVPCVQDKDHPTHPRDHAVSIHGQVKQSGYYGHQSSQPTLLFTALHSDLDRHNTDLWSALSSSWISWLYFSDILRKFYFIFIFFCFLG